MDMTTIEDLYKWAVENGCEKLPVGVQYQDGGGCYSGDTWYDCREEVRSTIKVYDGGKEYVLLW